MQAAGLLARPCARRRGVLAVPAHGAPEWPAKPRHPPMPPHIRRAARPPARAKGALLAAQTFATARLSPAPAPARRAAALGTAAGLGRPGELPCGRGLAKARYARCPARSIGGSAALPGSGAPPAPAAVPISSGVRARRPLVRRPGPGPERHTPRPQVMAL